MDVCVCVCVCVCVYVCLCVVVCSLPLVESLPYQKKKNNDIAWGLTEIKNIVFVLIINTILDGNLRKSWDHYYFG